MAHTLIQSGNFTMDFGDCHNVLPFESWWFGDCVVFLMESDRSQLIHTEFVKVVIKISLVYANISKVSATGVDCDNLRLDAFKSASEPSGGVNSTSPLTPAVARKVDEKYAEVGTSGKYRNEQLRVLIA